MFSNTNGKKSSRNIIYSEYSIQKSVQGDVCCHLLSTDKWSVMKAKIVVISTCIILASSAVQVLWSMPYLKANKSHAVVSVQTRLLISTEVGKTEHTTLDEKVLN